MMDLAQCQPVRDHWLPVLLRVRDDMHGIEQLTVGQGTHGTTGLVSEHDLSSEQGLMKALFRLPHEVPPTV
jgi:hypothetical protein